MGLSDETYMKRALELAKLGEGRTAPNPMVGSVIVYNGKIIGEGFHQKYGENHAEVNAINSVQNKELLKESTIYVTLEPCSHFGKTPPCADLIIKHQIPRVVIAMLDPFHEVAGRGVQKLELAGCNVVLGVLEEASRRLNRRFITFHTKQRPYIILKWAKSNDGFVDIDRCHKTVGTPTWITNEVSRIAVHKQRTTEQAILVGTNTALKDNPSLTVRDWHGLQPLRLSIDKHNRLPNSLALFDGEAETIMFSEFNYPDRRNCKVVEIGNKSSNDIDEILEYLYKNSIQSIIVEGGPSLIESFIAKNYWDEAHVYTGKVEFGTGVRAPVFSKLPLTHETFGESKLDVFLNQD